MYSFKITHKMALNQMDSDQKINYYVQLALIIICLICGGSIIFSMFLFVLLPVLGGWQILDFIMLWLTYGYKKWYGVYLFLLSVAIFGFYFTFFSNRSYDFAIVSTIIYTWFLSCIYLGMRRMFSI